MTYRTVWVFCGDGSILPSGVFSNQAAAEAWIKKHALSGILTEYPLDTGLYEWALGKGYFKPRFPSHRAPKFIGRFTSAYLTHFHFENGASGESDSGTEENGANAGAE